MKKPYQKKWLPISAQLERLKSYGLVVPSGGKRETVFTTSQLLPIFRLWACF